MTFSRILAGVSVAAVLLTGTAFAQTETDVIEAIRAQVSANRQAVVAENLILPEGTSDAFWPLYREFHSKRTGIMDERVSMLREFRDDFDMLDDDKAKDIVKRYFSMQEDLLKLRKDYFKKFSKLIGDKHALRYFQIENKLDAIIDYDLAQVVPLAQ